MARTVATNLVVLGVLIPAVAWLEGASEVLTLVPLLTLHAGTIPLLKRDWRVARAVLFVTAHMIGLALSLLFGLGAHTHLIWIASVPLVYVLFDPQEETSRALALVSSVGLFCGVELAGQLDVLPKMMHGDTSGYAALSMGAMFFLLVQRTQLLADFNHTARRRLAEEHRRLEEAQATARLGSFDIDLTTQQTIWSRELFQIHGLDPAGGVPSPERRLELVNADDRAAVQSALANAVNPSATLQRVLEYRIVRPDGEERFVRWTARCVIDNHGRPVRLAGSMQDVTERKQHEAALVRAREAAEMASRTKSIFLANMSHELRTPMNGVLGMTALALESDLTREQREYVDAAHTSGLALLGILNDILDLSKIEAGKLAIENVTFSVRTVVEQAMQLLAPRAQQKALLFKAIVDERVPPRQMGDPVRVRQLLVNLLGNAVKFTEQGEVRLEVNFDSYDSDRIIFKVIDTGIGIPADRQRAIFDAFTQGDGSTTRRFGGTGLGLTICRELARLMKGSLDVISAVGEGSTFRAIVYLPKTDQMVTDHGVLRVKQVTGSRSAAPPRSARILLVEDNAVNARIASQLVRRIGHEVLHVTDGRQALDALDRSHFDLVLMDVQMPVMDGLEATRALRERERIQPALRRTPIVAMTANAMKGDDEECFRAGMDAYLSKPLNFTQLQETIERFTRETEKQSTLAVG
jgi:PAS domain S-box-containing protein